MVYAADFSEEVLKAEPEKAVLIVLIMLFKLLLMLAMFVFKPVNPAQLSLPFKNVSKDSNNEHSTDVNDFENLGAIEIPTIEMMINPKQNTAKTNLITFL